MKKIFIGALSLAAVQLTSPAFAQTSTLRPECTHATAQVMPNIGGNTIWNVETANSYSLAFHDMGCDSSNPLTPDQVNYANAYRAKFGITAKPAPGLFAAKPR